MVAMLLNGSPQLPDKLTTISPWIDCNLTDESEVRETLAAQSGRRVIKTHTPADGFPVWLNVTLVAVYRHPLDVFLSIRKHVANMKAVGDDHPMRASISGSLQFYLNNPLEPDDIDRDSLELLVHHYDSVLTREWPDTVVLHYADMIADHKGAVENLARALAVEAPPSLIDAIVDATSFGEMKTAAETFAPESGTGIWHDESAFFASGGANKWRGKLTERQVGNYAERLAEVAPDPDVRSWLEDGYRP